MRHRWPRISDEVMTAVRGAVTDVLLRHQAAAQVEVTIRVQPTVLLHHRAVLVDVATVTEERERDGDDELDEQTDVDQLKAYQDARFAALEL
jgi:hypothetical protein